MTEGSAVSFASGGLPFTAVVTSPDDPFVADFIGLRDRDLRLRERATAATDEPLTAVFVAEGDNVVVRALRAGYRLTKVLVDATRTQPLPPELVAAVDAGATLIGAGPEVLFRITGLGVHRGCLGVFERRPLPAVGEILATSRRLLVLERVVNPVNLGVICRSAVGLGMDGLLLDDASVDPLYRRASRVAMGEVFEFAYTRAGRFPAGLDAVTDAGFTLVALTPAPDAEPIDRVTFGADERVALVLGSEGPGLTAETMARCDRRVVIPLAGNVDSLNVGAAAAIACYAITRG
ncbi:MAG: RNA methyltransferase [Acidimicrobiales bacterium]